MDLGFHWDNLIWNGTAYGYRSAFVIDRSNDSTVTAAIHEAIDHFNSVSLANNQWGIVPILQYLDQNAYAYAGCDGMTSVSGFNFMSVCSGGPASGASITYTSAGHAGETGSFHPHIHIQREYPDYNTTFSHVYHEILHGIGIGHSSNCADLMGGAEFGCKLKVGVKRFPTPADINPMTLYYFLHPMNA